MILREMQSKLLSLAQVYPVVTVMGPRQSGKTTLVRMTFPDHTYVSLEKRKGFITHRSHRAHRPIQPIPTAPVATPAPCP